MRPQRSRVRPHIVGTLQEFDVDTAKVLLLCYSKIRCACLEHGVRQITAFVMIVEMDTVGRVRQRIAYLGCLFGMADAVQGRFDLWPDHPAKVVQVENAILVMSEKIA